ncbi:MAG TPA: peptidylprolyl isomerase [Thermoanaerobaculia bacterium]|nr:peptidylprolyl isomerase [Thermoanaerobaculia bacterium]
MALRLAGSAEFRVRSGTAAARSAFPSRIAGVLGSLVLALALAGCAGLGRGGPAEATRENRISLVAGLMKVEDRRDYDPIVVGRASASKDPWVRSRAALTCGRLRDAEASIHLPVLLRDPDPSVRRAAAFASGISGDRRLLPGLVAALSDPDAETGTAAAIALGRLGGSEAEGALRAVLAGTTGPRAAASLALYRSTDPALVPLLAAALEDGDAGTRRSAAWALARIPRPGSEEVLRGLLDDIDPEIAAWAARGLGLLEDDRSEPQLVELATGAASGPAIQALLALDRLAARGPAAAGAGATKGVAMARARDANPGVAAAALTLLRRFGGEAPARELLATVVAEGGRRGGVALASLAMGDADRALALAYPLGGPGPLDLRLGAAAALPLLPSERLAPWVDALLADPAARVRMEAISHLPRDAAHSLSSRLVKALADPDGSVRAAALDVTVPLASGPGADAAVQPAWRAAYASALASREADLVASALDAAASLAEGGCALLAARRDNADDQIRARARRLLVEKCGEDPGTFSRRPFDTRFSGADYRRLAQLAESGRLIATVSTTRGSFEAELISREAPMTAESFASLARKGFFDGTTIHRVVPDFVVQAGDPRGDGTGGPGYALRDELNPLPYVRGRVGMALSGADTGGSQWFVTLSRQPHLDGGYTVFGDVIAGMDVVERIEQNDRLVSVRIREESWHVPPGLDPESR